MRDVNGLLLMENGAVRKRLAEYFYELFNFEDVRDADIADVSAEVRMPVLGVFNVTDTMKKWEQMTV